MASHGAAPTTGQCQAVPTRSILARGMPAERIVIVGAGPAGFSTARAYRGCGGDGAVTLVGVEPRLPYERPPLTKAFLRGEMDVAELTIEPEAWFDEHDVELCLGRWTSAIDPQRGIVTLSDRELRADAIVLATGSEPVRPQVPGAGHPLVLTIRALLDSERLGRAGRARPTRGRRRLRVHRLGEIAGLACAT